jgi:hypothetical protein
VNEFEWRKRKQSQVSAAEVAAATLKQRKGRDAAADEDDEDQEDEDEEDMPKPLRRRSTFGLSKPVLTPPASKKQVAQQLIKKWLKVLSSGDTSARQSVLANMRSIFAWQYADARPAAQDQIKWLLTSEAIRDWLHASQSHLLVIQADTPPDEVISPIAYTSAMLANSLLKAGTFPTLVYFCGMRSWTPSGGSTGKGSSPSSATLTLLKSLIAQLLLEGQDKVRHFPTKVATAVLGKKSRKKTFASVKAAIKVFSELVRALPRGTTVFVVLDSLSRLDMLDRVGTGKLLAALWELAADDKVAMKLVLTDMTGLARVPEEMRSIMKSIYLPDDVDGGEYGFHEGIVEEETQAVVDESFADD